MSERVSSRTETLFIQSLPLSGKKGFKDDRSKTAFGDSNEVEVSFKKFFHIRAYRVDQVYVPGSWYNCDNVKYVVGATTATLNGQYTAADVVSALNAAFTTPQSMNFAYEGKTKKFRFWMGSGTKSLVPQSERAADLLGIPLEGVSVVTAAGESASQYAEKLSRVFPYDMLYIDCAQLRSTSYNVSTGHTSSIVAVPVHVGLGEDIHWEAPQEDASFAILPAQQQLDFLSLRIIDQDGHLVDLNGVPFQITLTLDTRSFESIHTSAEFEVDPKQ